MTPIFTAEGDSGETGFLGRGRISKTSIRIETVGSVDEANAALGFARALIENEKIQSILLHVQKKLYLLMAELSTSPEAADQFDRISQEDINWLESRIETLENEVESPQEFIIPGDTPAGGALDVARTIVRRAERKAVALLEAKEINKPLLIAYLNRLSSLVFILEVYEESQGGGGIRTVKEI
jgi:cob(I)alamin adenosyltransferase